MSSWYIITDFFDVHCSADYGLSATPLPRVFPFYLMADGANWSTAAISVICAAGCFFIAQYTTRNRNEGPFPPGPKPRFLIGNALDIPFQKPAQTYLEWSKRFQSMICEVVLNFF